MSGKEDERFKNSEIDSLEQKLLKKKTSVDSQLEEVFRDASCAPCQPSVALHVWVLVLNVDDGSRPLLARCNASRSLCWSLAILRWSLAAFAGRWLVICGLYACDEQFKKQGEGKDESIPTLNPFAKPQ